MNENINNTIEYIRLLTGEELVLDALDVRSLHLPLFMTAGYSCYVAQFYGIKTIFVYQHINTNRTPAQIAMQSEKIRQTLKPCVVVFVFERLASYNVLRIIQKRVNFIIPGKQLFLPDLLIDLGKKSDSDDVEKTNTIPAAAQLLLLYHLQKENLNGKHGEDLATILKISPAGITRAVKWLCINDIAKFEGKKYKTLQILLNGKELWDKVCPLLDSPIMKVVHTDENVDGIICGQNALAEYGMIVEANYQITALDKQQYQTIKTKTDSRYGDNLVEIWKYDPRILSNNGFVDKLSLFLSMRNDSDERTQKELRIMLEQMPW